jgi:hypothetical protein
MICKHCAAKIADKALICYKCGHATVEPRVAPVKLRRKRPKRAAIAAIVLLVLLLLLAWWLGYLPPLTQVP